MTAPAHPQRCETCNKCEKSKDNPNWIYCTHIRKQPITHDFETFIAWRGCASHSSAQSRDQVLDELIKWMIEYWQYEPNTDWLMDEFMIHLTELRTQGSRDP